ncbi:Txe/YoeB family addiction module toxin [uncultured Parolsenella sp.]|uniref:Txe/YoeB family addiction module toxin n=1 Tax=uncultured Parolsenella sp. TaxID=2083008 RepID=UPI0027D9AB62|nr:Txe/YoeB family addiction module toxin [uncultured Parolsenella sp.]
MRRAVTTPRFEADYVALAKSGDGKALARVDALMEAALVSPYAGIGKPEPLRGDLAGLWSRRVDRKDRLIYSVEGDAVTFLQCRGHYDDR